MTWRSTRMLCVCHGQRVHCYLFWSKCFQVQLQLWAWLFPLLKQGWALQRHFQHLATWISWPQSKNEIMHIPKHKHIVKYIQPQIPNPATLHGLAKGKPDFCPGGRNKASKLTAAIIPKQVIVYKWIFFVINYWITWKFYDCLLLPDLVLVSKASMECSTDRERN